VRRRILAAVLLTTTLAVVAFFVPAALAIRNSQRRGDLLELQREASIVANRVATLQVDDGAELEAILAEHHPLGIYSIDGRLLVGTGPGAPDRIVRLALDGNFAEGYVDGDLVAAVPVSATPAHPPLVVRIEEPASESRARFLRSLALLATAGLAIIAVAAAVGMWVAARLSRPIEGLTEWAAARPSEPVPPPQQTGVEEIDSLRTALVDDRARIDELLRRERSFSSQVSHQLRTPVAAMRVAIEAEVESPRHDRETVLRESLSQLDRLESTISSLLALARQTDRQLTELDLAELVAGRAELWREEVERAGRTLTVGGEPLVVLVDADALGHVLDVLIDNAIRHGRGEVRVSVGSAASQAFVDVGDGGPTPEGLDPFADAGSDSSHGIGLRLARSLAESGQGTLELLPSPTTTFRLTLPA
jgi:signal transduction histidine kinase